MRTSTTAVLADLIGCQMLTRQGNPCGKPGDEGLPAGICSEHAVEVYRSVARMVDAKRVEEAAR